MAYLGIPLSKVGAVLYPEGEYGFDWPSNEQVAEWVDKIKTRGLAGLSLFSINKENNRFFLQKYAQSFVLMQVIYLKMIFVSHIKSMFKKIYLFHCCIICAI